MSVTALSDMLVLDLTRVRAGPTAVRQLADWGANVIKIEPPEQKDTTAGLGGDRHGPDFQNIHRNKRGLTINLKDPRGHRLFMKLTETADVVVENYRPKVKDRLGIDYEALKAVNPRIILASLSGFGQSGPYADRPAFDQIIQGMAGLMSVTGLPAQGPVRAGIPVADLATGLYGAIGILIALLEREKSGQGQWIQTSLIESLIAMMDFQAARYLIQEDVPQQAGNHHPTGIPTGTFRTSDGYINIAADSEKLWRQLCNTLGLEDMADHPDYATLSQRSKNRDAVNGAIEKCICTGTVAHWMDVLVKADIPCGPVNDMREVFTDPHISGLNMRHPVIHKTLKSFDTVGQPVKMSRSKPTTGIAAPERGEHTDIILDGIGLSGSEIRELRDDGVI
ncbi:MAG: CoA transferase [Hyphomicrobiaceae bacterium]|nr:CoA transferase [Hyphomicrobiaceae bacterium]